MHTPESLLKLSNALGRFYALQEMRLRQAQSVSSVHVPIKLLTNVERTRLAKVNEMLDKGQNPYNAQRLKDDGKNLGGSNANERVINYDALEMETEAHYQARLDKWSERPEVHDDVVIDDLDLRSETENGWNPIILDSTGKIIGYRLYCTFCSKEVEAHRATLGKGDPRKIVKREVINLPNGLNTIDDKLIHVTDKTIACPECCLKVKDTKFPDFD